jgi:hypothetical protein
LGLAAASGLLAVLAHPSALPVIASGALVVAVHEWRRSTRRASLWPWALALAVSSALAAARYGPILAAWGAQAESPCCHSSIGLGLSLLDWMTAPVLLCALVGMAWWWWAERGPAPSLVAACALVPTALFLGLSEGMTVSLSYLFAAAPFYFLAAGWCVASTAQWVAGPGRPALLPAAAATVVLASANLVGLASHFRDGGRLPYRAAASALSSLAGAGDTILTEGTGHLRFYLAELAVAQLPSDSLSLGRLVNAGSAPWILAPRVDRAGFGYYEREFAQVYRWLDAHCASVQSFTTPRLDFRHNALELYHCGAGVPTAAARATSWSR